MSRKPPSKSSSSRWWYGVAFFIGIFVVVQASYEILHLVSEPQAGFLHQASYRTVQRLACYFVFHSHGGSDSSAREHSSPLYSLCLYLDVRALRQNNSDWIPNRMLWGGVATLHLGSFVFSAVQLITIPAGVVYLYKRRKEIGLG